MSLTIDNSTGEIINDDAWERHGRICNLRRALEYTFLELGRELYEFNHREQYKTLGHPTLNSYLADPDVDIGRRMAFRLMGVYATYVLGLEVSPVTLLPSGCSKLDILRPYVTEENVENWVYKAAALSRSDLRIEIAEAFGAPHLIASEPELATCPKCGHRFAV